MTVGVVHSVCARVHGRCLCSRSGCDREVLRSGIRFPALVEIQELVLMATVLATSHLDLFVQGIRTPRCGSASPPPCRDAITVTRRDGSTVTGAVQRMDGGYQKIWTGV